MRYPKTKKIFVAYFIALALFMGWAANAQTEPVETKIVTIKNAQISGINDNIVTVVYTEGKRKVYDPIILTTETQIYSGKKLVTAKNLRLKQYLTITGIKQGFEITAQKINIGWIASIKTTAKAKIPVNSAIKKTK
jgi:regulatory protein YycI of two-component signal transduction system YycFG